MYVFYIFTFPPYLTASFSVVLFQKDLSLRAWLPLLPAHPLGSILAPMVIYGGLQRQMRQQR